MKKIIVVVTLLMASSLYAQTMLNFGFGGEYDFSIVGEYDNTESIGFLTSLIPHEEGDPAHALALGLKGEYGVMLDSGFTFGGEAAFTVGLSTKTTFHVGIHFSPVIGYSFLTNKLMQIYINPVTLSLNPFYFEKSATATSIIDDTYVTQVLDFKTGLSFSFSEMGLRNESAEGYTIGANIKWGQLRFNSVQKGFKTDLGFGVSFFTKNIDFIF